MKLMQVVNVDGVADIARFFKLTDEEGWCAGNESASVLVGFFGSFFGCSFA